MFTESKFHSRKIKYVAMGGALLLLAVLWPTPSKAGDACTPFVVGGTGLFVPINPSWSRDSITIKGGKTVTLTQSGIQVVGPTGQLFYRKTGTNVLKYLMFGVDNNVLILDTRTSVDNSVDHIVTLVNFSTSPPSRKTILTMTPSTKTVKEPVVSQSPGPAKAFLIWATSGSDITHIAIYRSDNGETLCPSPLPFVETGDTEAEATAKELIIHCFGCGGTDNKKICPLPSGASKVKQTVAFPEAVFNGPPDKASTVGQFEISNHGDDCLTINFVTNVDQFKVLSYSRKSKPTEPISLPVILKQNDPDPLTVKVSFTPDKLGTTTRALPITLTPTKGDSSLVCEGKARAPVTKINFSPTSIDFGCVPLDTTQSRTLTISGGETPIDVALEGSPPGSPFTWAPFEGTIPYQGKKDIPIQFHPTAGGGSSTSLSVMSNVPGSPITGIGVSGKGAVPIMTLEPTEIDYGNVELGFAFTKLITIHNPGCAPLQVRVSDEPCRMNAKCEPHLAQWQKDSLNKELTILAGKSDSVKPIFEPQDKNTHEILLRVSGDDPMNPSQDVTLKGTGQPAHPIDSVLVLDRSGSMAQQAGGRGKKIEALRIAARLFTRLLRDAKGAFPGDALGLVRYNEDSRPPYLDLKLIEPFHRADALDFHLDPDAVSDFSRLLPSGETGIGGAIQTAADMLRAGIMPSPPTRESRHVMIVLTDGKENRNPLIETVLEPVRSADPLLEMYSIGLGKDKDIDPQKLQLITNHGRGGYHQTTADLSEEHSFDLESFYFKIFANATRMDLAMDPTHLVHLSGSNPLVVDTAPIISSDRSAIFLVFDDPDLREDYHHQLLDPLSNVIVDGSLVGGMPVERLQHDTYTIYRVVFPDVTMASTFVGDWVLRLVPKPGTGTVSVFPNITVPIGFSTAVRSNYKLQVGVLPSSFVPGGMVTLTASLSDSGLPAVNGVVSVDVITPNGEVLQGVSLYDDGTHGDAVAGDGTWTTQFFQTFVTGSYQFLFHTFSTNERGELTTREASRFLTMDCRIDPLDPCSNFGLRDDGSPEQQ